MTPQQVRLPSLGKGATFGIVSPASPIPDEEMDAGIETLERLGFKAKEFPHTRGRDLHLAGSDQDRASDLMAAFSDPEVDAVLCSRGGYGCARLVPYLDFDAIARTAKPFLGFSDITTIHLALNHRGLPTLHAPMVGTLGKPRPDWVLDSFVRAISGDFAAPDAAPKAEVFVPGSAQGILYGGCLTLLADSLGTRDAFDGTGKIVFIEEVGEKPYRVDAMLTHLLNAGAIQGAAAILIGEMTGSDEKREENDPTWREIVRERIGGLGIPLAVGYPVGHIEAMLTIPLGVEARFEDGALTYP